VDAKEGKANAKIYKRYVLQFVSHIMYTSISLNQTEANESLCAILAYGCLTRARTVFGVLV
jgi:hypothetical protein